MGFQSPDVNIGSAGYHLVIKGFTSIAQHFELTGHHLVIKGVSSISQHFELTRLRLAMCYQALSLCYQALSGSQHVRCEIIGFHKVIRDSVLSPEWCFGDGISDPVLETESVTLL